MPILCCRKIVGKLNSCFTGNISYKCAKLLWSLGMDLTMSFFLVKDVDLRPFADTADNFRCTIFYRYQKTLHMKFLFYKGFDINGY